MRYVLDSSVALKWVLPEPESDIALRLRDETRAGHHDLIAPDVFTVEVAHALTRAERQRRILLQDGWHFMQEIMLDGPALLAYHPPLQRAYEMSSHYRIGVYDCLYVALAEREGCEVVTADARLVTTL